MPLVIERMQVRPATIGNQYNSRVEVSNDVRVGIQVECWLVVTFMVIVGHRAFLPHVPMVARPGRLFGRVDVHCTLLWFEREPSTGRA
jgi:hypothetical protein